MALVSRIHLHRLLHRLPSRGSSGVHGTVCPLHSAGRPRLLWITPRHPRRPRPVHYRIHTDGGRPPAYAVTSRTPEARGPLPRGSFSAVYVTRSPWRSCSSVTSTSAVRWKNTSSRPLAG